MLHLMADILFVPETDAAHGIGHFKRVAFYVAHSSFDADILVPGTHNQERLRRYCSPAVAARFVDERTRRKTYTLLIIDTFIVHARTVRACKEFAKIVCALDARGSGAAYCDYIIDVLPRVRGKKGNSSVPQLLPIKGDAPDAVVDTNATTTAHGAAHRGTDTSSTDIISHDAVDADGGAEHSAVPADVQYTTVHSGARRHAGANSVDTPTAPVQSAPLRALIYFSGKSYARRTARALRYLHRTYSSAHLDISIVVPSAEQRTRWTHRTLYAPHSINMYIAQSDVVVAHFGLTALTALLYKKELLLLDPSRYHRRCTRALYLESASGGYRPCFFFSTHFNTLINNILHTHPTKCPLCASTNYRIYDRSACRSFAQCRNCTMHFMLVHTAPPSSYNRHYFAGAYQTQYGKIYVDDFAHIYNMGCARLGIISGIRSPVHYNTILDIGCAYGPFMKAAIDKGYNCYGIDVNQEAVSYVKKEITDQVARCAIQDYVPALFQRTSFDIITMWYVIEHFSILGPILTKINALLPMGGIFAFSTPNRAALRMSIAPKDALRDSPLDHYTFWSKRHLSKILSRFGWRVRQVIVHGVHSEYYPTLPRRLGHMLSSGLGYGTTFSVYAEKISTI